MANKSSKRWGIDRRINIPTILQLGVVLIFGVSFYNNQMYNNSRTEERFALANEESKVQATQMVELQKSQNQMLLELTSIKERLDYTTDSMKDLSTTIKARGTK